MKFRVIQNPYYNISQKRVKPLHLYLKDKYHGKRNFTGLVHVVIDAGASLEIDQETFTDKNLLDRLMDYLTCHQVRYTKI